MRRRGAPIAIILLIAVAASLLTACSPSDSPGGEHAASVPASSTPAVAPTAVVDVPVVQATVPPPPARMPEPVELRIDAIDATLPVLPVGVQDDGSMEIPERPTLAGWYRFGPAPGAASGAAVIAAHVDDREWGVGPLARLRDLTPGSRVEVRDDAGETHTFEVSSVRYIPREALPVDEFFARTGEPSLVIITCGGSFDEATRSYSDNVVAIAHPVG